MASGLTLDQAIERISREGTGHGEVSRNLLHAYIACLSLDELCAVAKRTIDKATPIRMAIRGRMIRLARKGDDGHVAVLDDLALWLISRDGDRTTVGAAEALLSHLYPFFSPAMRKRVIERWIDKGTRSAAARWLRALADDPLLFDIESVMRYWRDSRDVRAAKLIAYQANSSLLTSALPELVRNCDEGWIVSKAMQRASTIAEDEWAYVRQAFPATYAYLCVTTGRGLGEAEALSIIMESDFDPVNNQRGLAIWAAGHLGLWSVLDAVSAEKDELLRADRAAYLKAMAGEAD